MNFSFHRVKKKRRNSASGDKNVIADLLCQHVRVQRIVAKLQQKPCRQSSGLSKSLDNHGGSENLTIQQHVGDVGEGGGTRKKW